MPLIATDFDHLVGFLSVKNPPRKVEFRKRPGHGYVVPLTVYTAEWKTWKARGSEDETPERYMHVDVWCWGALGEAIAQFFANDQREVLVEGFWGNPRAYEGKETLQFAATRVSPVLWEKEHDYGATRS